MDDDTVWSATVSILSGGSDGEEPERISFEVTEEMADRLTWWMATTLPRGEC